MQRGECWSGQNHTGQSLVRFCGTKSSLRLSERQVQNLKEVRGEAGEAAGGQLMVVERRLLNRRDVITFAF